LPDPDKDVHVEMDGTLCFWFDHHLRREKNSVTEDICQLFDNTTCTRNGPKVSKTVFKMCIFPEEKGNMNH
jgi:hypothetical protein